MLGYSDWKSTASCRAQVEIYPPYHLLYGCLLIQHCSKSLIEDCGGSSHTTVDRAGSVKIEAFTSLILCRSYVNSSLVHARLMPVFSPGFTGERVQIISHDHAPHLDNCQYQTFVSYVPLSVDFPKQVS